MNIALVSCGPSASAFSEIDHEGPVIAVSRQGTKVRSDILACFDLPVMLNITDAIIGTPKLFTIRATLESLQRRQSRWYSTALMPAEAHCCPVERWTLFTAPACLVLAAELGATTIHPYGVDMTGDGDSTGGTKGNPDVVRTEARWARERGIWEQIVDWLKGKGVEVRRAACQPIS